MKSPQVMPTKEEILEKARQIFAEESRKAGMPIITPEEDELKEGSYYDRARDQLMRDVARAEELKYIEEMARDLGLRVVSKRIAERGEELAITEKELRQERKRRRLLQERLEKMATARREAERKVEVVVPAVTVAPPPIEKPIPKGEQVISKDCYPLFSRFWDAVRKGAAMEVSIPTVSRRMGIGAGLIRKAISHAYVKNIAEVERLANKLLECECLEEV